MELGFKYENKIDLTLTKKQINKKGPNTKKKKKKKIIKKKKIPKFQGFKRYGKDLLYCIYCKCFIQTRIKNQHLLTIKHKNNYIM